VEVFNERHKAWGFLDKIRKRIYFNVPVGGAYVNLVCEFDNFDLNNLRWSAESPNTISAVERKTAIGLYEHDTLFSNLLLLAQSDGKIMRSNDQTPDTTDAGTAIQAIYETPDLTAPLEYQSSLVYYNEVEFEARGAIGSSVTLTLQYSVDEGVNYTTLGTVVVSARSGNWNDAFGIYRIGVNKTFKKVRFNLTNGSNPGEWSLRWFRAWRRGAGVF
jgi:hypothetical protein